MARTQILIHTRDFAHHTIVGILPQAHERESLLRNDRYLRVKNSNKNTSELLTLSPCLKILCFLSLFGRFRVIPGSFRSTVDGL